ncbi:MAG: hypothetical protein ACXWQR_16545 [Ktedonobacterales bacterium]
MARPATALAVGLVRSGVINLDEAGAGQHGEGDGVAREPKLVTVRMDIDRTTGGEITRR